MEPATPSPAPASPVIPPPTLDINGFEPDADRASFLDQRMRSRLAASLRHILDQGAGVLGAPGDEFQIFLRKLEQRKVSPLLFSLYSDTVLAIEEDEIETARSFLLEMLRLPWPEGGIQIRELGDLREDATSARYARFINTDDSFQFEIFPPPREAARKYRELIGDAFDLMNAADPALAAEIRALLREIVLGAGTLEPKAMTFDGASAFMLWGAVIINANQRADELTMVQMLAHESAHNLLFGIGCDEPLVENSPEELFPSPLRL
ncbi:MAG TPA: HEXXH motif-containing putative peptide modification protein, partial [Verrucomicrobiae bacterium]|nr:HEXXH motif-containing putative peptide modification protein [Verrucomicrobiae bacterium]